MKLRDYLTSETLRSAGLKDHVDLIARKALKSNSDPENYEVSVKSLAKQYHAREEDIMKMLKDKVKELSKK